MPRNVGNSDIEEQIREVYDFDVSTSTISRITEKVLGDIVAWQERTLEPVYMIVWMDGIVFKVGESSKVIDEAVHIAVGLRKDGKKEVLGLWLGRNEPPAFWMLVLTDIRARGTKDVPITATDNLIRILHDRPTSQGRPGPQVENCHDHSAFNLYCFVPLHVTPLLSQAYRM